MEIKSSRAWALHGMAYSQTHSVDMECLHSVGNTDGDEFETGVLFLCTQEVLQQHALHHYISPGQPNIYVDLHLSRDVARESSQ